MKVLAIIGSLRKGNSYKITQRIEEKLKGLGDIEFNYIFLLIIITGLNEVGLKRISTILLMLM